MPMAKPGYWLILTRPDGSEVRKHFGGQIAAMKWLWRHGQKYVKVEWMEA